MPEEERDRWREEVVRSTYKDYARDIQESLSQGHSLAYGGGKLKK
tara:strand:+ start:468 stop:602 length:135 start_codon:yes stop_codon:yes gene_type:complete